MQTVEIKVLPEIVNINEIYEYYGRNISRERIIGLMQGGFIKSAQVGRKLVAERESVIRFKDVIFEDGVKSQDIIPIRKVNIIAKHFLNGK
jgi:hypothetical protein